MPASDDLRDGMAEAFDVLSEEFHSRALVTLLKVSTTTDAFDDVIQLTNKRFFEYSNFRKNTLLEIADASADMTEAMAEATHVRIDTDVESTIYNIIQADTLPPSGTLPVWRIFLELFEKRGRFTNL
jgi:hypothetical protein